MPGRTTIDRIDDLDLLSAIWILSCNDENPIVTYVGIRERLLIQDNVDVQALVLGLRELFRPNLPKSQLEEWKDRLRTRKELPSWLASIQDTVKRHEMIDNLSPADVFRNQFRTGKNTDPCDLKIVDWGLQHLDRLRKAAVELRTEKLARRTSLIVPLATIGLSTVVAVASLLGTFIIQARSSADQFAMKQYEVSVKPRQDSYASFMVAFGDTVQAMLKGDEAKTLEFFARMESAYFQMEPFLGDKRQEVRRKLIDFSSYFAGRLKLPAIVGSNMGTTDPKVYQEVAQVVAFYRLYFNETLFNALLLDVQKR